MHHPKIIFIIPYRERTEQKFVFEKYMKYIMEDYKKSDYRIFFVEQKDMRDFNRGALKNIGFLAMKKKYPLDYKKITFVFNDIDTFPYKKGLLNYRTKCGYVKHFFGFENTLGGIFSITGEDFESVGGFPNFWTWGYEDNVIQNKILKNSSITIDRSNFYPIFDHKIVHMTDSLKRIINLNQVTDKDIVIEQNNNMWSINNLQYKTIETMIYVTHFDIVLPYIEKINKYEMNLTDNPSSIQKLKKNFVNGKMTTRMQMNFS